MRLLFLKNNIFVLHVKNVDMVQFLDSRESYVLVYVLLWVR